MTKLPTTGQDWELYTCSMKCGAAARALTAALKKAETQARKGLRKCRTDEAAEKVLSAAYEKHVWPAMCKFSKFGATDTEPRGIAKSYLDKVAEDEGIYGVNCW